jgi:hypothetical protein
MQMKTPQEQLELKRWLAEQLPEKLKWEPIINHLDQSICDCNVWWITITGESDKKTVWKIEPVRETEWEHITRLVEEKLCGRDFDKYYNLLYKSVSSPVLNDRIRKVISASWPTRATALKATLTRKD